MNDVSKFIPINENGENEGNNMFGGIENVGTTENCGTTNNPNTTGNTWEAGNVTIPTTEENCNVTSNSSSTESTWKIANSCTTGTTANSTVTGSTSVGTNGTSSEFRVCGSSNNLPAKRSFWAKVRSFFFYDAEELAELERQKAKNVVNETAQPQESTWTKIKKWFFYEDDSSKK